MDMDPKTLSDWAQWLVMAVISLVIWLRKPGEDAKQAVNKLGEDAKRAVDSLRADLDARMHEHSTRLTSVETHLSHMPTSEELAELEGTVKQIQAHTVGLTEALGQARQQLNRIEGYLLRSKD